MATLLAAVALVVAIPAVFRVGAELGKYTSFANTLRRMHLL
jgi:hypothetical protein